MSDRAEKRGRGPAHAMTNSAARQAGKRAFTSGDGCFARVIPEGHLPPVHTPQLEPLIISFAAGAFCWRMKGFDFLV